MYSKNNIILLLKKGKSNAFLKGFSFLLGGTALTQGLTLILAPILTRLYAPEDYGVNSLYISTISILAVFATLRFNAAITITENIFKRIKLMRLCIVITTIVFVISLLVVPSILYLTTLRNLTWIWFIPFSILLLGFYEVQNAAILSQNKFKLLAKITVLKIGLQGVLQIVFAYLGFGYAGLILGNIISIILSLIILLNFRNIRIIFNNIFDLKIQRNTFRNFLEFPKFAFPAEVASVMSLMLFPFVISYLYDVEEVGFFGLANKLIGIPIGLFGNSIRQVFIRDVSPYAGNANILRVKYLNTSAVLFVIGIAFALILYFIGPTFFSVVFGERWFKSGIYVQSLTVLLIARITVTPLLSILNVINKQNASLIINMSLIVGMTLTTIWYKINPIEIQVFLFRISLVLCLVYILSYYWTLKLLKG